MPTNDFSRPPTRRGVSRRRFVQSSVAVGAPMLGFSARAATSNLEAYASATSVKQGGTLDFFARDPKGSWFVGKPVAVSFTRMGSPDKVMSNATATIYNRLVPTNASSSGCRWARTYRLAVPTTWPSGVYWATFGAGSTICTVPFVVRPAKRTAGASVMVQIPVNTAQAYNNYGGKSLYEYNSTSKVRGTKVSFDRPLNDPTSLGWDAWTPVFVRWLEAKGIVADFCTSVDLHADSTVLTGYKLMALAGHDEYWSLEMRNNLDKFVASGGNAAILSGNTIWWQARFDASQGPNRTLVCYKSATLDPTKDTTRITTTWSSLPKPFPANASIGLSSTGGAAWTSGLPRPDTPFVVQRPNHWVFEGLNFSQGTPFAGAYVGYETDTASFRRGQDSRAYPTGTDGSPASLKILAVADATDWNAKSLAMGGPGEASGRASIAVFSRGGGQGTVFNGGVIDWVFGLQPELDGLEPTPLSTITLNVFRKLSGAWSESTEVRQLKSSPAAGAAVFYYTVGTELPSGLTLAGAAFSAWAAANAGTTPVYRFYASADGTVATRRYLLSTDRSTPVSSGWTFDNVAFHAYAADAPGRQAVYQFSSQDAGGNQVTYYSVDTLNPPEGWVQEGVAFYVPVA